jgi:hypothetical protein
MVLYGLLFGATLSIVAGTTFAIVGRVIARRSLSGDEAFANTAFVTWWYALAGLSFASAGFKAAAGLGVVDVALQETLLDVSLLVLCVGLWGLGYYLAYLFTGQTRWNWILAILYSIYYVFLVYFVVWAQPVGVDVRLYDAQIVYERDLAPLGPWLSIFGILLIGPQFLGALAYASLLLRVKGALPRYRIGLVSATFLIWFGSSLVAGFVGINDSEWWPPVSQAIGVAAAWLILIAYNPPAAVLRRLEERDGERPRAGE